MDLMYKKDVHDKDILLNSTGGIVMMKWEQPYMEACINELKPKGDVLEIGFGMGYSATQIQKYKPKSHTIIECDGMVVEKVKEWSKNYDNIIIIEGTWQKQLNNLGNFDEIFFDDYPLNPKPNNSFEYKLMADRFFMFIDICLDWHMNDGAKISAYLDDPNETFKERITRNPRIKYYEKKMDIEIPDNCKYYRGDKAIIPIIKKVI